MALPSTGDTWANILQPGLLPTAVRKGIITDIIIGDYLINGVPVNFATAAAGLNPNGVFTPFAADGQLRSDLLAKSSAPTFKGFHIGLLNDNGWTFTPNLTVDQTQAAQTIWSIRNDVTKAEGELMFTAREWKPLIDLLRMDLPTLDANGNSVVPDPGTAQYSVAAPGYQNLCERWIIALGFDGATNFSITCPRVSQKKLGKTEAQKKNAADLEFSFELLLDPNTSSPYIVSFGGSGWVGEGGAPVFPGSAPVATATTTGKATVAFADVTGTDIHPIVWAVEKSVDAGVTWSSATLDGTQTTAVSESSGTTTIKVTGLATGATKFRVKATGSNNVTTTSLPSNSATIT